MIWGITILLLVYLAENVSGFGAGHGRIASILSGVVSHADERPKEMALADTWEGTALHLGLGLLLVMVSGLYAGNSLCFTSIKFLSFVNGRIDNWINVVG